MKIVNYQNVIQKNKLKPIVIIISKRIKLKFGPLVILNSFSYLVCVEMIQIKKILVLRFFLLFKVIILICFSINNPLAQTYKICGGLFNLWSLELNTSDCVCSNCGCLINYVAPTNNYWKGISMSPEGLLFSNDNNIYQIDPINGFVSLYFNLPSGAPILSGIVAMGNDIFYTMTDHTVANDLYEINVNAGTIINLGPTDYESWGDMTLFDGNLYYPTIINSNLSGIVKVDISNPANSSLIVTYPGTSGFLGLTASTICNTLIGTEGFNDVLVYISLIDGTITSICETPNDFWFISSMLEFESPTVCQITLDLDCNDSSGATDSDFNSPEFNCLSAPVVIADEDIGMLYDAYIETMTIQLTGFVPDAPSEILEMSGSISGINAAGVGTDFITLTNAGAAKSTDFKDALHLIFYDNTALLPTAGLRTVEVQFTTEAASMSNIATAFIQVNELSLILVDLGPDQQLCEGETATFDAGNPGASYDWSNNATSQSITVGNSGEYIVTVSNGINCPNQDTVELEILPVIHLSLSGDTEICDNEQANMTLTTDSPFPLDVVITPNPGSPFTLTGVEGSYDFFDLPSQSTEYTITNVIPSEPACVEITDPSQVIYVYATYINNVSASICDGDSIWLGYYWETEAGVYEILFDSEYGCDSTVNFTIEVLPAINIAVQGTTCNPAEVGIFISFINNPNGCDTVVQTTVSLLPSDTTSISLTSCNSATTGVFTQLFMNQQGCDSLVITTIAYAISDYTYIDMASCDSSALGVFMDTLISSFDCDSVVLTTVTMASSDTSYLSATSCDSASIGIFQSLFSNQSGCDSLVITTVSAGIIDTTYLSATSCDSSSLGVFEMHFNSQLGCDSTVFTTVAYAINDYSQVNTSSCDPGEVGVFVDTLLNRFGCDSIVTLTVAYAISHNTTLTSSSCDPADTGVFVQTLINQFGCDSIVTLTVAYAISHNAILTSSSCNPADTGVTVQTWTNQFGCDSIVTLTVSLVPADTTILSFKTCDPGLVGNIQNTFTNHDGCDSLVIEQTSLYLLPELLLIPSDFNGYGISCFGESDGSVIADVLGVPPFTYSWSTGDSNQTITGLLAGSYAVTVTDSNGCTTEGEVMLVDPGPFMLTFMVSQPDCFDQDNGSITAQQIDGVAPVRYSIDGVNYQSSPTFSGLSGGTYEITALDANDCEVKEIIWINVPLMVHVELGDDQIITPGGTTIIRAIVNVPYDSLASITWSGLINPNCPTCLTQPVVPIVTTTYSVSVTSVDGCSDEDALTLFLERKTDIYIPNIFSPNGDNFNDRLLISAGEDVEEISLFVIYDRWGNMVYSADHFQANDIDFSWDGTFNGNMLNSSVFAYKVIAQFKDGRSEVRYGDVTLLK